MPTLGPLRNVASAKTAVSFRVGVHGAVVRDDARRAVRIVAMVSDLTMSKQAAAGAAQCRVFS